MRNGCGTEINPISNWNAIQIIRFGHVQIQTHKICVKCISAHDTLWNGPCE